MVTTLHGHTGRVNCVRWVRFFSSPPPMTELLSGGVDGHVIVWSGKHDKVRDGVVCFKPY